MSSNIKIPKVGKAVCFSRLCVSDHCLNILFHFVKYCHANNASLTFTFKFAARTMLL